MSLEARLAIVEAQLQQALQTDVEAQKKYDLPTRISVSTANEIANPAPLGLFAFGVTTTLLNFKNASVTEKEFAYFVVCYGMFFGGLIQLLAGMWEFAKKNTFSATVFSSYGGFWMGYALWYILIAAEVFPPSAAAAKSGLAVWFAVWCLVSILFGSLTLRMNRSLQATFVSLIILFILLIGGIWNETCEKVAGAVGIFCGLSAIYLGYAQLLKEIYGKWVLPIWEIKKDGPLLPTFFRKSSNKEMETKKVEASP